jgi:hypothetical protein
MTDDTKEIPDEIPDYLQNPRFNAIAGKSLMEIVIEMNKYAHTAGKLLYIGRNFMFDPAQQSIAIPTEAPFIAIFDNMPVLVQTIEDQMTFTPDPAIVLKYKDAITA